MQKRILFFLLTFNLAFSQSTKWMSVGSLHSWFSSMGSEVEEGRVKVQQDGLRWPAIYKWQDMEAAKGMWIGYVDHDYGNDTKAPYVVHIGPRVNGLRELFPTKFETVSKFDPPQVFVDGNLSLLQDPDNNRVDATIKADRMIINEINSSAGISITRKILQFSQQYHDNYFIYDYTFTNSGNTDSDAEIEKTQTLKGVYFYFQVRSAISADTRFVIGQNPTGWGINTMNDARGDGATPASTFFPGNKDNDIRAVYAWHGKYPPFTLYDNIGGPIWTPYYDKTDTVGRLGAAQFVGTATIHADKSAIDKSDDIAQPSTMGFEGSDEAFQSNNDHLNYIKNNSEYLVMSSGRRSPRHADKIGASGDPSGGYSSTTTSGGQSYTWGYGPYTLAPSEKINIIMVEAAAGLSREACVEIGRAYKQSNGNNSALINYNGNNKTKNDWVYTGRDSLFQTFRRAIANGKSNYSAPTPPTQPKFVNVKSGANKIQISWDVYNPSDPLVAGFQIYRAVGRYDSAYHLIYSSSNKNDRSFDDTTAAVDVAHYYYLVSVGNANDNNSNINPTGVLTSSRYYTQTFDPAYKRVGAPLELKESDIRIVPNPYNISAAANILRYAGEDDKITFKNIPGICTIRIYSELAELINTIEHTDGTGTQDWMQVTSSKQIIVSGVYIAVITTPKGEKAIKKFIVIR